MKKLIALLAACLMLGLMTTAFAADEKSNDIVILYTNDVHCAVDDNIGYAGLAAYKKEMQAAYNYVALVDCGDSVQGFICIAAKPEVYPGADRTSLLVTLSNEPGSLYQVLARIYGRGINLTKLESRPIPGSDDTFRFYFDLEASVYSPELPKLLDELESVCEHVCYLGSYSETV